MPLDPGTLDDLTWRSMVDAVRRRIPAASAGEWTLHAPVDPGITLLELYAWLLEQRLYWLDHVPDALVHGALRLLGDRPETTSVARTVIRVAPADSQAPPRQVTLRARTPLTLDGSDPEVIFTTLRGASFLALADTAATITYEPAPPSSEQIVVRIDVRLKLTPQSRRLPFNLLVELDVAPTIAPEWDPRAARIAPALTTAWQYSGPGGVRIQFASGPTVDGTQGLRRSGIVSLRVPADWTPALDRPGPMPTYSLWIVVPRASVTFAPRIRAVTPNVVFAEHRRHLMRTQRLDWLPLPQRTLAIGVSDTGVLDGDGPLERGASVMIRERDGTKRRWRAIDDFVFARAADRVFTVDRARQTLVFGDGYQGRLPNVSRAGGDNAQWVAWLGGGPRGNVGTGRPWLVEGTSSFVATNVVAGIGGREALNAADLRARGSIAAHENTRAVTAADYEEIAIATPGVGVARAHAAIGASACDPCPVAGALTLFIVPFAPRDESLEDAERVDHPMPDEGMLGAVRKRMERARLVGTQVFVRAPLYRAVELRIEVVGLASQTDTIRTRLGKRMRDFLDPLVGGDDGNGWPFGDAVRPSGLVRQAQDVMPPSVTIRSVAASLDGIDFDDCGDTLIGEHRLPYLAKITVNVNAPVQNTAALQ